MFIIPQQTDLNHSYACGQSDTTHGVTHDLAYGTFFFG